MDITRELFDQQRRRRFGESNPERMRLEFWERMVREEEHPYLLRQQFGLPDRDEDGPIWCFHRMGQTRTGLADGRVVCVGGEYEDWYDPDFCIYNDVVVLAPGGDVAIYGYPKETFPPTDFHTATLVGERILLIGCLGYPEDRASGVTPVYSLDIRTHRIERVETHGDTPGWIFHHTAEVDPTGETITVRGGETIKQDEDRFPRNNVEEYRLDLRSGRWERITDRRAWRQFLIGRQDGDFWFDAGERFADEVFRPKRVPHEALPELDWRTRQIAVRGVGVSLTEEMENVRVIVRGELPAEVVRQLVEDILANVETASGQPCRVLEL
jgi:hypothetical protein